jgi:anion-transporting  ArsA/GET3 family ATPase
VPDFADVRLHVVTGKGGTGKTTVAAALALALASGGGKVLLAEVEGRQGIAQLFDTPPLPYEERKVAVAPGGGDVYALAIDPEQALLDYLHMFYKLSPNGIPARTLRRMGAIDFATTIAPGLRDVLLTGKIKEAVVRSARPTRKGGQPRVYDAVVPRRAAHRPHRALPQHQPRGERAGPGRPDQDPVRGRDGGAALDADRVHLVTLLEEMPVQETLDGAAELEAVGLPVGGIIVNAVRTPALSPAHLVEAAAGRLDGAALTSTLTAVGLTTTPEVVGALIGEANDHAERVALEERGRDALAGLARPTYELPLMADAVALDSLYELAGAALPAGDGLDGPARAAAPGHRRRAGLREDHRLLRLRGRREDDDRRGAGPARGRARPAHGGAHHRPGPPAGAVDGALRARQHAPRRGRDRRLGRRLARRDDAGHEAHVRRDRRRARRARQGPGDPGQPLLPSALVLLRRHAGVHGDGEARAAPGHGDYDLVVVDTPPTGRRWTSWTPPSDDHAHRTGGMVRILRPGQGGGKAYLKVVTARFALFTSASPASSARRCLQTSRSSVAALETMFGGFRERAQTTYDLLKSPGTQFVVVAAPERDALREASYFVERLAEESMPLAGLVVNRVHRSAATTLSADRALSAAEQLEQQAETGGDAGLAAGVLRLHAQRMSLSLRERRLQERFSGAHPGVPVVEVAALPGDVHDLDGLRTVGADLAGAREATAPTG